MSSSSDKVEIVLNENHQTIAVNGTVIDLTMLEWSLVWKMYLNRGKLVHYQHMFSAIWGMADVQPDSSYSAVNVMFSRIRKKLRPHLPSNVELFKRKWGMGKIMDTTVATYSLVQD